MSDGMWSLAHACCENGLLPALENSNENVYKEVGKVE